MAALCSGGAVVASLPPWSCPVSCAPVGVLGKNTSVPSKRGGGAPVMCGWAEMASTPTQVELVVSVVVKLTSSIPSPAAIPASMTP